MKNTKKTILGAVVATLCALAPISAFSDPAFTGEMAFYAGEYLKAKPLLLQEASQGNGSSAYYLGLMYRHGNGVQKSQTQSVLWFKKAAAQGHQDAQEELDGLKVVASSSAHTNANPEVAFQAGLAAFNAKNYTNALALWKPLADQGYAPAQYNLGAMYGKGQGVVQNYDEAVRLYREVADKGYPDGQYNLGIMYYNGSGVPQSYKLAVDWFEKAANGGKDDAMVAFAKAFEIGEGRSQNLNNAKFWYERAAGLGNEIAKTKLVKVQTKLDTQTRTGRVKSDGFYDQPQKPVAKPNGFNTANTTSVKPLPKIYVGAPYSPWTKRASTEAMANLADKQITNNFNAGRYTDVREDAMMFAKYGMARYQIIIGKTYFKEKNYTEAMRWYKRAAAAKSGVVADIYITDAQYLVGAMYDYSLGVPEDRNLAAGWYALASNHLLPDKKAAFELGLMYELGEHIPQDDDKAISYYTKAGRENGDALFRIGFIYEKNISKNFMHKRFALEFYEKSAATGNPFGQFALGTAYSEGKLTSQSYPKAIEWFEKSAAQDNPDAQHNLAMLYANGQGVTQSYEKAVKLLEKAAWQDFPMSQYALGIFYADGKGVEQSEMMARFWLRKAAKLGDKPAQEMLKSIGQTW